MANFENQYFRKMDFTEVRFTFAYDALIKIGIALIAKAGYKVRSQPGHHVKIIEKLAEILADEDIALVGNKMRQSRNADLYDGGILVTQKDSREYTEFVEKIYSKASPL